MRTKHTQHLSLVAVAVLVALLGVVSGLTLTVSLNNGVAFADDIPNAYNSFTFTYKGDAYSGAKLEIEYTATEVDLDTSYFTVSGGAHFEASATAWCLASDPSNLSSTRPKYVGSYIMVNVVNDGHDNLSRMDVPFDITPHNLGGSLGSSEYGDELASALTTFLSTDHDYSSEALASDKLGTTPTANMVVRNSNDDVVVFDTDSPAGEYTITVTLTGDDAAKYTAVYTYVITPKAVVVSAFADEMTYSNEEKGISNVSYAGIAGDVDVDPAQITYSLVDRTNYTGTAFYAYVEIIDSNYQVAANGAYAIEDGKAKFGPYMVQKRDVTAIIVAPSNPQLVYDGSAKSIAAPTFNKVAETGTLEIVGYTGDRTNVTVGGFTVSFKLSDEDAVNYNLIADQINNPTYSVSAGVGTTDTPWGITKAAGVFVAPTTRGPLTYDPSSADPQALINAGSSEHGTIKYKIGAGEYSTTIPAQRNANVDGYDVYYKLFGDSNHEDSEENLINVVINKLEVAVEWSGTTVVYAGANVEPDDPVATITNNNSEDVTLQLKSHGAIGGDVKTISYTAVNMELVGAASANYSYSDAAVTFKINPRPVVIAWDADSFPYTGLGQNVTATITNIIVADAANVAIEYNTSGYTDAGNHTTTVADLTGTRAFNYTLTGGTNLSKNWSITKVDPTCTLPTAITGLTYTSSTQVLINAGVSEHGLFEYKLGDGAWTTDIAHYIVGTEAQDYVVRFRFTGDENHNDIAATVIEGVTIGKAASSVTTAPTASTGLVYTGVSQNLLASTGVAAGGTMKFSLDGETWDTSIPQATDANLVGYTVWYKVACDEDHSDTAPVAIENIVIAKADPVVSGIELRAGWTYNGESNTLITNFGSVDYGTLVFADSATGGFAALTNINVSNAGAHQVWYKVEAGANWNAVEPTLAGTVTVAKANPVVTAPTPYNNLTFTNGMQALVAAGSTTGGELQYKIGDGNWSTAIPTATLANENPGYTVWYRVVGDDNHNDVAAASIVTYIAKADSYVIEDPVEEIALLYDAQAHALFSKGGTANGGEVQYRLGTTGEWSESVPTAINANENGYSVWYKVVGDSNHNDTEPVEIYGIVIAKRPAPLKIFVDGVAQDGLEGFAVYDGQDHTFVVKAQGLAVDGWVEVADHSIASTTVYDDGVTYTSEYPFLANYVPDGSYSFAWGIEKREIKLSVSIDEHIELIYGDEIDSMPIDYIQVDPSSAYGFIGDPEDVIAATVALKDGNDFVPVMSLAEVGNVGRYYLYVISLDEDNYDITFLFDEDVDYLEIVPRAIMITPTALSKKYGEADPAVFTYTVSNFAEGEENQIELEGALVRAAGEDVGNYAIAIGTLALRDGVAANANYELQFTAINFVINKAVYDMSGITFADVVATYDGQPHVAVITGELPQGVSVSYTDATLTDVGTIDAIAHFNGDTTNYNPIPDMNATITLNKAAAVFNLEGVVREFKYTGANFSIGGATVSGDGEITYVNNSFSAVGKHVVTINSAASANYLAGSTTVTVVVFEADPVANPDGSKSYYKVIDEQQASAAGVDVSYIFESAKADTTAKDVKLEVGEVTIVFNGTALDAIGGNDVALKVVVGEEAGAEMVLNITLNGATFAEGKATVNVPYANAVPSGKVVKVYFVDANGSRTDMNATLVDGVLSFDTNHFSKYIVAVEEAPKGGLSGGAIAGIVIAVVVVVAGAAVGVFFFLKKKKGAAPKAEEAPKADEPQIEELPEEPKEEEQKDAE